MSGQSRISRLISLKIGDGSSIKMTIYEFTRVKILILSYFVLVYVCRFTLYLACYLVIFSLCLLVLYVFRCLISKHICIEAKECAGAISLEALETSGIPPEKMFLIDGP